LPIRPIQPLTSQAAPIRDPNSSSFYIPSSVVDRNQDNASSDRQIRLLLSFTRSDNIIILNIIYLNFLTFDMKASNKCFQWIGFFFLQIQYAATCQAFLPSRNFLRPTATASYLGQSTTTSRSTIPKIKSKTALSGGLFGGNKISGNNNNNNNNEIENQQPSRDSTTPKRVLEIPVQSLKKGGLRFALGLHLIGQQNTPDPGSWRANQSSDTVLDMFFRDNSAMFSVVLEESKIVVDRYGSRPSLPYMLQESVILHKVLDELKELAFGGEGIEEENRLVRLEERDGIEKAREVLPARSA